MLTVCWPFATITTPATRTPAAASLASVSAGRLRCMLTRSLVDAQLLVRLGALVVRGIGILSAYTHSVRRLFAAAETIGKCALPSVAIVLTAIISVIAAVIVTSVAVPHRVRFNSWRVAGVTGVTGVTGVAPATGIAPAAIAAAFPTKIALRVTPSITSATSATSGVAGVALVGPCIASDTCMAVVAAAVGALKPLLSLLFGADALVWHRVITWRAIAPAPLARGRPRIVLLRCLSRCLLGCVILRCP